MQQQINTLLVEQVVNDDVKEAKRRLEGWGSWLRACTVCKLGFPNHATFAGVPAGITAYDDAEADEIERILARMMSMSPLRVDQYRSLVQAYYFQSSNRLGAEHMRCSVMHYRKVLDGAENYLAGVLVERRR